VLVLACASGFRRHGSRSARRLRQGLRRRRGFWVV
jgi:hypothetical protein